MNYDAIVIGAGQAGPSLAARLTQEGLKTAIIERDKLGGTCVNVGCTPTKTLVGSARVAHLARRSANFGIDVGDVAVDMKRVKARMDKVRGDSNRGISTWLQGIEKLDVIHGHAQFVAPNAVEIDGDVLYADRIFINVGARPRLPEIPGLQDVPYFTSSTMLEVDFIPDHLVIIGGSYIGLEFAQMYRRFGSQVTVVEKSDRLLPRDDADVAKAVQTILEKEGVHFELGAECVELSQKSALVDVAVSCDRVAPKIAGSHVLIALGREPNTNSLGLDRAGIETNQQGFINVDDQLRTNVEGIWALGDINGRGAFTHTAYNDFEIVAANLFSSNCRSVEDRIDCYALFVDPPLGRVGLTERAALDAGYKLRIGTRPMTRVGRAREFGETQGFIKVLVDAETDKILGAAILGLNGDEAIHGIVDVMNAGLPYVSIQQSVHIHPTVSELIPTVLSDLQASSK